MTNNPLVSVIIPTYNREKYIVDALESVLAQSYNNLEIIVVDDGSTDNTIKILKERYKDSDIVFIYKENEGVSSARNVGIKAAIGDYIAFLDSDDEWLPEKLKIQIEYSKKYPELSMIATEYYNIDENGKVMGVSEQYKGFQSEKDFILLRLLFEPPLIPSTLLIKKQVFNKVGEFDEQLSTAVDLDFNIRAVVADEKIGIIREPLLRYKVHNIGISKACRSRDNRFKVVNKFLDGNPGFFTKYSSEVKRSLSMAYYNYARTLLHEGFMSVARKKLIDSLSYKISLDAILLYLKSLVKSAIPGRLINWFKCQRLDK